MDDYKELIEQLRRRPEGMVGQRLMDDAADAIAYLLAKLSEARARPDVFHDVEARLDELKEKLEERKDDYPPGPGPHRFA